MESECQLRATSVCVCVCLHIRESSVAAAAGWQPERLVCPSAHSWGNWEPWKILKQLSVSAQLLKELTLQDDISQQRTFCLSWQTEDRTRPLVHSVSWSAVFSSSVTVCGQLGIYVHTLCAVYAHMSSGHPH